MDREIWINVMQAIHRASRELKYSGRTPLYPHRLIVAMYLWSVFHDRCLSWACERDHYGALFRPGKLPSISQFTRRIKTAHCQKILAHVHEQLMISGVASSTGFFDGKPLLVSAVSKDRQAASGHIRGGFAKGYKLHAYVNDQRRICVWTVMPLNVAEQSVAMEMCDHLPAPAAIDEALVMADGNYDSHLLHRKLAESPARAPLLTPLKGQSRVGEKGHHPVTLRQMGPQRRELLSLWEEKPDLARYLLKSRNNIEGVFSVLCVALGLSATLPAFVRGLVRVRRWVGAKIILYHARLLAQERRAAEVAA
jgi:hypothetical protein